MSELKAQVKFVDKNKSEFYSILKNRVDQYFTENNISKYANATMVIKTIILLLAYILHLFLITVWGNYD